MIYAKSPVIIVYFAASLLSIPTVGQDVENEKAILSSFYQGEANNCASVALIKAAMHRFGYNKIFSLKYDDDGYALTLKNGQKLTVSDAELLQGKDYSRFETNRTSPQADSVIFYAQLAYAAIAKYIEKHGYWDCEENDGRHLKLKGDYGDALTFISRTSFCTDYCYRLLGMDATTSTTHDYNGAPFTEKGIILYSWRHAVFAIGDQLDCYGDWEPATSGRTCGQKFKFYLVLK